MSAHLKFGTIHPRTLAADLDVATREPRLTCGSWRSGISTPPCCSSGPPARGATGTPPSTPSRSTPDADGRDGFEAWKQGRTGYPDRRRRHAPTAGAGSCTTGSDDRGLVPGQGPAPAVAVGRALVHASSWSTPTWPATSTAGSGALAAAPTRRRTSGCSTPPRRARSSTPPATTSGVGSLNCADDRRRPPTQGRPSRRLSGADRRPRSGAQRGAAALRTDRLKPSGIARCARTMCQNDRQSTDRSRHGQHRGGALHGGRSPPTCRSAAWGWSKINHRTWYAVGIFIIVFLLGMLRGNHVGHVEDSVADRLRRLRRVLDHSRHRPAQRGRLTRHYPPSGS